MTTQRDYTPATAAAPRTTDMFRLTGEIRGPSWMRIPTTRLCRRLLGLLLTRAGEVVTTSQIIEELWGEKPPASVMCTMQTYVMRLRKSMNVLVVGDPQEMLELDGPAYRLNVPRQQVDALAFMDLVQGIRESDDPGRLAFDVAKLGSALSLVPGDTLANVSCGPQLEHWQTGFEEARLQAKRLRVKGMLRLGRHREVLAELAQLCHRHHLHEGFHALLILALYRSQRTPEALAHYQKLWRSLDSGLGIRPHPSLQALHRAIINGDEGLFLDHLRLC